MIRLIVCCLVVTISGCSHRSPRFMGAAGLSTLPITVITNATVINGTGVAPSQNTSIVIRGTKIVTVGSSRTITIPTGATVIDGSGLFVLPGFIDANAHLTNYSQGDTNTTQLDSRIVYLARQLLSNGVTTIRDSYGVLHPLRIARDSINSGNVIGTRILFAGNIVGWGGPGSWTFSMGNKAYGTGDVKDPLVYSITQGVGEELIPLDTDSLRIRIRQYLDKGVNFIKYGATTHGAIPNTIIFSEHAQRTIVEEAHKRGLMVETHATTPEGLRMALAAGVDLVQHAEVMETSSTNPIETGLLSNDLVQLLVKRRVICVLIPRLGGTNYHENRQKLIAAGCRVAVSSDANTMSGVELLESIEALVQQLGMAPMAALVASTRTGAEACDMVDQIGTVEVGKLADLIVLKADPLSDIRNIRKVAMVFKEGKRIDPLPSGS